MRNFLKFAFILTVALAIFQVADAFVSEDTLEDQVEEAMREFDADHDKKLTIEEMQGEEDSLPEEEEIKAAFRKADKDQDKKLDKDEMINFLINLRGENIGADL